MSVSQTERQNFSKSETERHPELVTQNAVMRAAATRLTKDGKAVIQSDRQTVNQTNKQSDSESHSLNCDRETPMTTAIMGLAMVAM